MIVIKLPSVNQWTLVTMWGTWKLVSRLHRSKLWAWNCKKNASSTLPNISKWTSLTTSVSFFLWNPRKGWHKAIFFNSSGQHWTDYISVVVYFRWLDPLTLYWLWHHRRARILIKICIAQSILRSSSLLLTLMCKFNFCIFLLYYQSNLAFAILFFSDIDFESFDIH